MEFTCPFCNHPTTITSPNLDQHFNEIDIRKNHLTYPTEIGLRYRAIACPNRNCKSLTLDVSLKAMSENQFGNRAESSEVIQTWKLMPESSAKPQPSYIPSVIVSDYSEACRIKSLSPKASATLSRRCLQGMIRDFWSISKSTLAEEIKALESVIDPATWEAVDAVRSLGNIGAHMEKDVNLIVEIDEDEAQVLISLIEDLFEDWYVTRYQRAQRLESVKKLAAQKQGERKSGAR